MTGCTYTESLNLDSEWKVKIMSKIDHKPTQNERIIDYMMQFGSITQIDALKDIGCMRLASRISDLRRLGYPIISKTEAVKNRYGEKSYIKRYSLAKEVNT